MRARSPAWHAQCLRLRAEGWSVARLAELTGKRIGDICWVLDEKGEREAGRRRSRESLARRRDRESAALRAQRAPAPRPSGLSNEAKMAIARAFAAGEIDRATLSARLRGGA